MKYDDDRYIDEDDNDLWDDELELTTGDSRQDSDDGVDHADISTPRHPFNTYEADDNAEDDDNAENEDNDDNDYYSDPEPAPQTKKKSRRERFFGGHDAEDANNDFYDSDVEPVAPTVSQPKPQRLDPEDPDYWIEEEESPLSEMISKPVKKWKWILCAALLLVVAVLFGWIWFFRPYTDSAMKYGYIKDMERRGSIIKTFEGSMIPYKELGDPNPFYFQEVRFSVESDSLAAVMKRMMLGCVPVRLEYELYHTPIPWKGEEKMIVIKADTADPRKILPPEYRGKY